MTAPNKSPLPPGEGQGEGHNLLTTHLPLLAGAPNGIKKLRELILELAVRGKLVPQDPNDEPASELLKRIAEEKARLVAEGKIKNQKALPKVDDESKQFDLPAGWEWARLGSQVLESGAGWSPSCESRPRKGSEWGVLKVSAVSWGVFRPEENKALPANLDARPEHEVSEGDFLVSRANTAELVAKSVVVEAAPSNLMLSDKIVRLKLTSLCERRYVNLVNSAPLARAYYSQVAGGTSSSMKNVSREQILNLPLALPPLAEQHRIVAKVDELMALCDRLETRQTDADSAHAQLVQALLDSLTQARDAVDFTQSWQRLAEHFHTLFTTESSIDALKQTLLQLAVMGKLVPQDPSDEPASIYYGRQLNLPKGCVRSGKQRIKEKALTGAKDLPCIPESWVYRSIDELYQNCHIIDYADGNHGSFYPRKDEFSDDGVIFLTAAQIATDGTILWHECPRLSPAKAKQLTKGWSELGDVFYTHNATVGRTAISREGPQSKFLLGTSVTFYRVNNGGINPSFLYWYFSSRSWSDQAQLVMRQTTRNQVSITKQALFFVALPPLAEQHRIVAKVNQLMALCDQLKTRLSQARQLNEQLANTLVKRALVEDQQHAPVATDRKVARSLLAAEITHQLHGQRTFGQRKLQKVIYLAEHAARLAAIQGSYLRNVAGPHDRQLMNQVEDELHNRQWYQRIERDTIGHAYHPLAAAGQHRQEYESAWPAAERATIQQVIDLMRGWDTDRCERVVTLYAAWNDFLLEGKAVTDEALVAEVMYSWNDAKLRFTQAQWLAELSEMKKHKLLTPSGFGKRTQGGLQTLPGLH